MRHRRMNCAFLLLVMLASRAGAQSGGEIAGMRSAAPEAAGFSVARLERLDRALQEKVDGGQLAGIVTLLARHGSIVHRGSLGFADIASGRPMSEDAIFRIYSMSKPITGVAMMLLYEEGKWKPSDPISQHVPELAELQVYAGVTADGQPRLERPAHAPTMGELMTHTAGFTYGVFGDSPVDRMYREIDPLQSASLESFIGKLAGIPLAYQPGEQWVYSVSVDIQGYIVEKLSGQPFADFLEERIFDPIGMTDTGFFVPESKLDRLATIYVPAPGRDGDLAALPRDPNVSQLPGAPSGGGGLYSTAGDYLRFAQMLLNEGELDGVRLLAPSSVRLMRSNHLAEDLMDGRFGIGFYTMQPGLGFGYDVAVLEDPARLGSTAGQGSYLWDGVAGTWFWIDPANDLVFVGLIQRMLTSPGAPNMEDLSRTLVYQALVDPGQ